MARSISRYEQYWKLLKANRGKWLELQVPAEFQERVIKAIKKRKCREQATTANFYPELIILRLPENNLVRIKQPLNGEDTI